MNFAHYSSALFLSLPSRLSQKNENEEIENHLPTDDEKEIDDDFLQTQLESFLTLTSAAAAATHNTEGTSVNSKADLGKLQQGDFLVQCYLLKLEKRINVLRKTYEETAWAGTESIKVIEKQDIGIIVILRNLIATVEGLVDLFGGNAKAIRVESDRFNNILNLLLYCDNLEINYLVLKFVSLTDSNLALKTMENCRLLENFYLFFTTVWRAKYPFIGEIFKGEKFYKDTGAKPVGNDTQGDGAEFDNPGKEHFKLEVGSVKKEFSDFFSTYYQTQLLLTKENLFNPATKVISPLFVNVMLTLRLAKNFPLLKNRVMIALIQGYSLVGGRRYSSCIDAQRRLTLSKDLRLLYAMKGFPYGDFHMELLKCLMQARNAQDRLLVLSEDLTLDFESRFVDDFKIKFISEETGDFLESVKIEEASRYFNIFSLIFAQISSEIHPNLASKNSASFVKLEHDSDELLASISKYFLIAVTRFTSELESAASAASTGVQQEKPLSTNDLLRLFNIQRVFIAENAQHIKKLDILTQIKAMYKIISAFHKDSNQPLAVFQYLNFIDHRQLLVQGSLKNEMREFFASKLFFDACFNAQAMPSGAGEAAAKLIFAHCDFIYKIHLHFKDEERIVQLGEIVSGYLLKDHLQLQYFPAANLVLNAFITQFKHSMEHARIVEKASEARLCYVNLEHDQEKQAIAQGCTIQPAYPDDSLDDFKNAKGDPYFTPAIVDASFPDFTRQIIPCFKNYLQAKKAIISADSAHAAQVIARFPNFQRNVFVRSYVESLLATNAFRASYFQMAFFSNLLNVLPAIRWPDCLKERDVKELIHESLDLVHSCSVGFKVTLLNWLHIPKDRKIVLQTNGTQFGAIQIFLELFVDILAASPNTLTFFTYEGLAKNPIIAQRNVLSVGDHTSILVNSYDAQTEASLRLLKQLCTLYALFKSQVRIVDRTKQDRLTLSQLPFTDLLSRARRVLPRIIVTQLPKKVEYYISKMESVFEQNFQRPQPNAQVKRAALTYLQSALDAKNNASCLTRGGSSATLAANANPDALHVNTFNISRTFLADVDQFHGVKKGLEKYLISLPQQILKATQHDEGVISLTVNLYSEVSSALLAEVFTGRIRADATIKEAFADLAVNLVAEQEIRKSLTASQIRSPFDQLDYYTKLASLSQGILVALRKFKIGNDTSKILKEPESAVTREAWYKYQFYVLALTFLKWWTYHFQKKETAPNVLTMEDILGGMNEADIAPLNTSGEVLKILILDTSSPLKNTAAKEQCMTFLINLLNIRHFYFSNAYEGSLDLELKNRKLFEEAPSTARVFLGQYIARVFGEISRTGLALTESECKSIGQLIPFLQAKSERMNIAFLLAQFQSTVIELFKENTSISTSTSSSFTFNAVAYPQTDLFISMRINRTHENLPDGLRALLDSIRREITNTPSVNKGALLGALAYVIIEVINQQELWIMKYAKYDRVDTLAFFVHLLGLYIDHLTLAPSTIKQSIVNSSNMLSLLNVWLNSIANYLKESAKSTQIANDVLVEILKKCRSMFSKIVDLLESKDYQDYSKFSKIFTPQPVLRNLLTISAFCIGSLKYEKVSIDSDLDDFTKLLLRFAATSHQDFLVDRVSNQKNTNDLWTPLMRCFELIFTFQKENFVKSCLEIRLKNAIYVSSEKRFPPFFKLTQLTANKSIVKRDMLEHGRALRQVLAQLFEGIPEDSIIFQDAPEWEPLAEILPELIKDEGDFEEVKIENPEGDAAAAGEEDPEKQAEGEAAAVVEQPAAEQEQQQEAAAVNPDEDPIAPEGEGEPGIVNEDENGQEAIPNEEEEQQQQQQEQANGEEENLGENGEEPVSRLNGGEQVNNSDGVEIGILGEAGNNQKQGGEVLEEEILNSEKNDTRSIGFRVTVSNALSTSKVVKLSISQKAFVDSLVDTFESRINDSYAQAKEKQVNPESAAFTLFYVEFPFIVRMLKTLLHKYPLVIPYLLERKIRVPELPLFKKANVISFFDFLIVGGALSEFTSNSILEIVLSVNYTYAERKKQLAEGEEEPANEEEEAAQANEGAADGAEGAEGAAAGEGNPEDPNNANAVKLKKKKKAKIIPVIGSTEHYINSAIERTLSWTKKVIETKNFTTLEYCHTLLYGLVNNLRYFVQRFSSVLTTEQIKKIIATTTLLIKRSANQLDSFKLISLNVFELMAKCVAALPGYVLRDRNIVVPEGSSEREYINYFVNRNILTYFEKEKGLELEKNSLFNHLDLFTAINANLKLNVPEILQIRHNVAAKGPLQSNNAAASEKDAADIVSDPSVPLLQTEKELEGLFWKEHVIQSIDELEYEHHEAFQYGLQQLYDFYNKYPALFAKREHTASFIYCLSHLYVVLRRQTEFQSTDYALLESIYHNRPREHSQFEVIDEIIYNHLDQFGKKSQQENPLESLPEKQVVVPVPVIGETKTNGSPKNAVVEGQSAVDSAVESTEPLKVQQQVSTQNAGQIDNNIQLLQSVVRQTSIAVTAYAEKHLNNGAVLANSASIESDFDFIGNGYPIDALSRYAMNVHAFESATHEQKLEQLQSHKRVNLKRQKLQFIVEREKHLLDKLMVSINSNIEKNSTNLPEDRIEAEVEDQFNPEVEQQQQQQQQQQNHQQNNGQSQQQQNQSDQEDENGQEITGLINAQQSQLSNEVNTLRVYLQQNIIDFFNELPPKDQRAQAVSWDSELVDALPASLQLRVNRIKGDLEARLKSQKQQKSSSKNTQEVISNNNGEGEEEEEERVGSKEISVEELKSEMERGGLHESELFHGVARHASLERVLKHKNLVLEMVPSFDDEFILKLFDALHIYTSKLQQQSHEHVLELLTVIAANPYNAFRIVDLLSLLIFFYPRRGKVLNDPINQNGLNALVEAPVLILDKSITHRADADNKYAKMINYITLLERILAANQSHALFALHDYPIIAIEESQISLGRSSSKVKVSQIPLAFRTLDQLKDVKLAGFIKGQKDSISLHNLVGFAQKWVLSERNLHSNVLVFQNETSLYEQAVAVFERYAKTYNSRVGFDGTVKALIDDKYPQLIRPLKEFNIEEFLESFLAEIPSNLANSKRLEDFDCYAKLVEKSKVFPTFLEIMKPFVKTIVKRLVPELKRVQAAFLHKRTQIKQERDFSDLNDVRVNDEDFNSYNDFLVSLDSFLKDQMKAFSKSIKDISRLFRVALKEELKPIYEEFVMRAEESNYEQAHYWFEEMRESKSRQLKEDMRHALLVEDNTVISFLIELLQFMNQSMKYAWSNENKVLPGYVSFDYPLKAVLLLYDFLYPEDKAKRAAIPEANVEEEIANTNTNTPELSRMMTIAADNMLDTVNANAGMSLTRTMSLLNTQPAQKQFNNVQLPQLYDLISKEMGKLITFLVNSRAVKSKKPLLELASVVDLSTVQKRRLDAEKKLSQASAFAKSVAKSRGRPTTTNLVINCRREEPWQSSLGDLMNYSVEALVLSRFDVRFEGEKKTTQRRTSSAFKNSQEQSALAREWLLLAVKDVLDPRKGLFRVSPNGASLQPNPLSVLIPNHLTHFRYAGRLIAKALIEKQALGVSFTRAFTKHILHHALNLSDLDDVDQTIANNLQGVKQETRDIRFANLKFSLTRELLGSVSVVDLIPNGRNIPVTNETKKQYIKLVSSYKTTEEIKDQISAFLSGFYEVLPVKSLQHFTEKDFALLLAGSPTIKVDELKQGVKYKDYFKDSKPIKTFYEVLEELDDEQRIHFLHFFTGSYVAPIDGFKNVQLQIAYVDQQENPPFVNLSRLSMNLPTYESKEILTQKLIEAIFSESKQE